MRYGDRMVWKGWIGGGGELQNNLMEMTSINTTIVKGISSEKQQYIIFVNESKIKRFIVGNFGITPFIPIPLIVLSIKVKIT